MALSGLCADAAKHVLGYLSAHDAMALAGSCRGCGLWLRAHGYWSGVMRDQVSAAVPSFLCTPLTVRQFRVSVSPAVALADVRRLVLELVRLAAGRALPVNLLLGADSVSSVDRPNEAARNVMQRSVCFDEVRRNAGRRNLQPADAMMNSYIAQVRCGCAQGSPCYWCSASSDDRLRHECIRFIALAGSLVQGFVITPYQAFFQPEQPVYGPLRARVFFELNGRVYFESEEFEVDNSFTEQSFVLARPALFVGGLVGVAFLGMHRRQPLEEQDGFFVCISHVAVLGHPLPEALETALSRSGHPVLEAVVSRPAPSRPPATRWQLPPLSNLPLLYSHPT